MMRKLLLVVPTFFLFSTTSPTNTIQHVDPPIDEIDSIYIETKTKLYKVVDLRREVLDIEEENSRLYEEVAILQSQIINKLNNG